MANEGTDRQNDRSTRIKRCFSTSVTGALNGASTLALIATSMLKSLGCANIGRALGNYSPGWPNDIQTAVMKGIFHQ
jgi:hypothetical protein